MANKPKIILVTGFLGSGKTTLLNRLIEFYSSKKIGLIINDFGKIAIDGMLLSDFMEELNDNSSSIFAISNGSIFCSCLSAELVKGLKKYLEIAPEYLIIETSGLSDPSTFNKILQENMLDDKFEVMSSICIVDPTKTTKLAKKIRAIEEQIKSSNLIVINKMDIISDDEYQKSLKLINEINNSAKIINTEFAQFDIKILEKMPDVNSATEIGVCNTQGTRPESIILEQNNITKNLLTEFYEEVKERILRIKGFVEIENETYYVSDSNDKLKIQKSDKLVEYYGLSVLLPTDTIDFVENNWEQIINAKCSEVTNE